jgi:hypothetical protein
LGEFQGAQGTARRKARRPGDPKIAPGHFNSSWDSWHSSWPLPGFPRTLSNFLKMSSALRDFYYPEIYI